MKADSFFSEELYRSLVPPSHCNYGCFDDARKRRPNAHLLQCVIFGREAKKPLLNKLIFRPIAPPPFPSICLEWYLCVGGGRGGQEGEGWLFGYIPPLYPKLSRYDVMSQSIINHEIVIIYLRVNLAMVLIGFESKNDDFRLNFRVTPISSRAKKDFRRVTFLCPGTAPANSLSLLIFLLVFISSKHNQKYISINIYTRTGDLTTASVGNKLKRTSFSQEHSKNMFFGDARCCCGMNEQTSHTYYLYPVERDLAEY